MLSVCSNVALPALPDARMETRNEMLDLTAPREMEETSAEDNGKLPHARQCPSRESAIEIDTRNQQARSAAESLKLSMGPRTVAAMRPERKNSLRDLLDVLTSDSFEIRDHFVGREEAVEIEMLAGDMGHARAGGFERQ